MGAHDENGAALQQGTGQYTEPPLTGRQIREAAERKRADAARVHAPSHVWVGAAELPLTPSQARTVDLRNAVTIRQETKLRVIDAYCSACRRNYAQCAHEPCPAKESNEHLRGGPVGERKKRGTGGQA